MKPTIALFLGDPAGIGPELVAKLLADGSAAKAARIVLLGSRPVLEEAMKITDCKIAYTVGDAGEIDAKTADGPMLLTWPGVEAGGFERGKVTPKNGKFMLDALKVGLDLCQRKVADALCFAPLNKAALRAGGMNHPDELHWFCDVLKFDGPCVEFNVLEGLWTSRVTSHVPLKDVSGMLTQDSIVENIALLTRGLRASGLEKPRVAVCGFNPHNGDGGAFGREEIDIIEPAVERARKEGFPADGPYPADTIFVRATRKDGQGYDGVLTMFHDQGQIAMKLMGFERGVTVPGGLPIPIATPAHGTAYDIAGKGVANTGAVKNAFALACKMGLTRREQRA